MSTNSLLLPSTYTAASAVHDSPVVYCDVIAVRSYTTNIPIVQQKPISPRSCCFHEPLTDKFDNETAMPVTITYSVRS